MFQIKNENSWLNKRHIMSLVRPAELATTSYGDANLYSLKGTDGCTGLSSQMFGSGNQRAMRTTESYCSESFEKYFYDSPTEELAQLSSSSISANSFDPEVNSYRLRAGSNNIAQNPFDTTIRDHNAYQSNSESDYLDINSPDPLDFDDQTRLTLQELERALLEDNDNEYDEDEIFEAGYVMDIDGEWADPTQKAHLHDSPKESTSSDSNHSSICMNKEISQLPTRTPKQLLFDCAAALSEGHIEEASSVINKLRQMVSVQGDPSSRIGAYMVEGLAARMALSGKFLYKALRCKEPPSSDRLAAMQILFEVCPCFKFGYVAANTAILEAVKDEKRIHIVDFDINQGSQYIALIQALVSRPGKRPHLRITGVDDPESVQRSVGGLKIIGQRLEKLAEAFRLPLEFRALPSMTSLVKPAMLDCHPEEVLIVNFAFQLHHMPDESVSTVNERDQLLRMVKSLKPKLVTVVEQDMNTNTTPFFPRFVEAYNYYSTVFASLDATLPRESQDRVNVERQCLARDIVNIVACEGEERIERYEVAGKWRARMVMAGFISCPMGPNVIDVIRKLIKQYCDRYKVKEEVGGLHFGWEDKNLIVASAWR